MMVVMGAHGIQSIPDDVAECMSRTEERLLQALQSGRLAAGTPTTTATAQRGVGGAAGGDSNTMRTPLFSPVSALHSLLVLAVAVRLPNHTAHESRCSRFFAFLSITFVSCVSSWCRWVLYQECTPIGPSLHLSFWPPWDGWKKH